MLYISQGTVFNQQPEFFQMCIDAFADSPYRVVMSKGNPSDARDTATYPSNIFVAPWLPQHEVVKRASVFVSQAGTDSTMQCLHYGVPMVVVPRQIEQMMNGVRVAQLGLGVLVDPGTVTSESLRAAVDKVHGTSSFLERARAMQKAVRASGGSAGAANAFRKYARSLVS